jgi:alcohol dehydrogenase class IV
MDAFVHTGLPARIVFGSGTIAALDAELARLDRSRAVVITEPHREAIGRDLIVKTGPRLSGLLPLAVMHTPVDTTDIAMDALRAFDADCLVAIGGGSTTGLSKALARRTGLDQIAIPTTYAGSEMTPILGETSGGVKTTSRDMAFLPETVIYDVDLTMTLPVTLSGTSGINAIAHAVEALYAQDRSPIISLMAEESIRALARALPKIAQDPADRAARSDALYGAFLAGACLGAVGMALHHKLCHTLGGTFDLPHAETHTIVLPHAVAYNTAAAPDAIARVAAAMGVDDAARGLYDLAGIMGAPRALKDIGMPESGIDRAADLAVKNPYWNPRAIERGAIRDLIARAWSGEGPMI